MPKQKNPKTKRSKKLNSSVTKPLNITSPKSATNKKLAIYMIITGILLMIIPVLFYFNQTIQLSLFTPKTKEVVHRSKASISEITIPAVNINVKVLPTVIKNGVWEIAKDGASHLSTSAVPGTNGPIILYAHKTPERFKPLLNIKPGKSIAIRTSDNKLHLYEVREILEVYPNQMEVFDQKDETLVLYTCSGFMDLKRFVVIAKPTS